VDSARRLEAAGSVEGCGIRHGKDLGETGVNPRLIAVSGPLKDSIFSLPTEELSLGRDASNGLPISDPSVLASALCPSPWRRWLQDQRPRQPQRHSRQRSAVKEHGCGTRMKFRWRLHFRFPHRGRHRQGRSSSRIVEFEDESRPMPLRNQAAGRPLSPARQDPE